MRHDMSKCAQIRLYGTYNGAGLKIRVDVIECTRGVHVLLYVCVTTQEKCPMPIDVGLSG